jgi:membrane protein YdbS with pleckstrin-like domain
VSHSVASQRGALHAPPGEAAAAPGSPLQQLPAMLRPERALLKYYLLTSFAAGPFFLFPLVPLYFKYHTLRYEIDEEGITMRWGVLFRREVSLTYARIQDIHLSSNFVERWFGLARIQVQTASGSAEAEMTIEGLYAVQQVRDFLYSRMRGARGAGESAQSVATTPAHAGAAGPVGAPVRRVAGGERGIAINDDLTAALLETAAELRALRLAVEARRGDADA